MKEVNFFCAWKDALDYEAEMKAQGKGYGFQEVSENESDEGDLLKVNPRSKGISKPPKKKLVKQNDSESEQEEEKKKDSSSSEDEDYDDKDFGDTDFNLFK